MTILITAEGEFIIESGDAPEVGKRYSLEKPESQTDALRKAWHALVQEWLKSGCHSYKTKDFETFRNFVKRDYGKGYKSYVFADFNANEILYDEIKRYCHELGDDFINGLFSLVVKTITENALMKEVETVEEIPEEIRKNKKCVRGKLWSFTEYGKKDVCESIDKLIPAMDEHGVRTNKYFEILKGLEENEKRRHE